MNLLLRSNIALTVLSVIVLNIAVAPRLWADQPNAAFRLSKSDPEQVGMSNGKLALIHKAMRESIEENAIVGGIVMIARDAKIVLHEAYGHADRENSVEMKTDTIVRIFSMTKAITSAAAMMLCDEGKLSPSDPVSKFIPELESPMVVNGDKLRPASKPILIADLLRHTSGLSYGRSGNELHDQAFEKADLMSHDQTLAQMQSKLGSVPLLFEPGIDWHYGISTDVLGRVVEIVSGMTLDQFFAQRIFVPLGMVDTGFFVPASKADRFAQTYKRQKDGSLKVNDDPKQRNYLEPPRMLSGGGGLVSTSSDYMRFLLMIIGGGQLGDVQLLRPETVSLMTTNQMAPESGWVTFGDEVRMGVGYGFGFNVRPSIGDWNPSGVPNEYGWGGAASTHYWVSPDDNLIVVTLEQVMPYQWHTEFKIKPLVYESIRRE
ncbi:serine hydrolase domain-containing protein [Neorhodopirellula pilleata]|uniref:Esterase EstB n=1 Tax=Neorhodopirellula pilleata TaxID=2714738 RepID=A0A5C5ZUU0_9BACT|nr:serine hydrolase domain-containing protein [Neorhodopirellula pilleata]TWT91334.1 Esterase EstB [Neorhodopirellula pilleata]